MDTIKGLTKKILKNKKNIIGNIFPSTNGGLADTQTTDYWTQHNVTLHQQFMSPEESLDYFHWRNDQYFNYINLMPVSGFDGITILDYGCGPGHDLIGFGCYSKPKKLFGMDISKSSLEEAASRSQLHNIDCELIRLDPSSPTIDLPSNSIDHIHCSGVLHHTPNPVAILKEFYRVLKVNGTANVMVYNYYSLWVHLYVAYQRMIIQNLFPGSSLKEQFTKSTDGEDCPISNCYSPEEWIELCESSGFNCKLSGVAISMHEASILPVRFQAIQDRRLNKKSREFLVSLTFDEYGLPKYKGSYAGIDACFNLKKQ